VNYRLEHVLRLPEALEEGVVYVSEEYEVAALNCACGCGHKITLLLDDGHEIRDVEGMPNVWPSIGVWDAQCRSHFFIRNGEVLWAEHWSEEKIQAAMERQLERHISSTKAREPWYTRFWNWFTSWFRRGRT
jgi:hypothetical protein